MILGQHGGDVEPRPFVADREARLVASDPHVDGDLSPAIGHLGGAVDHPRPAASHQVFAGLLHLLDAQLQVAVIHGVAEGLVEHDPQLQPLRRIAQPDPGEHLLNQIDHGVDQRSVVLQRETEFGAGERFDEPLMTAVGGRQGQHLPHRALQNIGQLRLGNVAGRARLEGLDRQRFAAMGGHQDDGQPGIFRVDRGDQFQAVHLRHLQIGQHEVRHRLADFFHGRQAMLGDLDRPGRLLRQQLGDEATVHRPSRRPRGWMSWLYAPWTDLRHGGYPLNDT